MSAVMMKRDLLLHVSLLDERAKVLADNALYLELAVNRMKLGYLPEVLLKYRWHGANLSRNPGVLMEDASGVYDRFWESHAGDLSADLRARARRWRSHWHLQTAIDAILHGDRARARRHIVKAACINPLSIRPGWIRMLGVGSPPSGPWSE